jgi:hypothetical protein
MLNQAPPFIFSSPTGILSGRERGEELLNLLTEHLRGTDPEGVTPLDFSQVDFIDISCSDEFLTKLLMRIGSGELGSRYIYIQGANTSVRETLEAVLRLRGLAALLKENEQVEVMGELKTPIREALEVLLEKKKGTSAELAEALRKNVNIACNRLNALQRMGLVCRVRDGSVAGGGRQYFYESIV